MIQEKIDVVITWVDGNDPEWRSEKKKYIEMHGNIDKSASDDNRFRDWDNLQYIFRGIEKFMPWVNKIHFVTWGHLPKWINRSSNKLNIVRHEDFIPKQYLPTFNSNVIETNLHRIKGLTDKFINFNDDMFVIAPTQAVDFFANGMPKDMACISPQPLQRNLMPNIEINNLKIINDNFSKNDILKNKSKWLNPFIYGEYAIRTTLFLKFSTIIGIFEPHIPFSYLKSTYEKVWEKEGNELNKTGLNKFRTAEDVNEWVIRQWQLMSGEFVPRSKKFGMLISAADQGMIKKLGTGRLSCKVVCINDCEEVVNFETTRNMVNKVLEKILPDRSSFEV